MENNYTDITCMGNTYSPSINAQYVRPYKFSGIYTEKFPKDTKSPDGRYQGTIPYILEKEDCNFTAYYSFKKYEQEM